MIIITNDNHTDHQVQMYERVENEFALADVVLLKVTDKNFRKNWETCLKNKQRCILFTMDNSTQINKLLDPFNRLHKYMEYIKNIVLIHDEADTITKDRETSIIEDTQAESHKLWLEFQDTVLNLPQFIFKRLFVTATPANCMALYKILNADIIQIEPPTTYSGYKDIQCIPLEDTLNIKDIAWGQVQRILDTDNTVGEAIIIVMERLIKNQQKMVEDLSIDCPLATIHTYNGTDMVVYTPSNELKNELSNIKINVSRINKKFDIKIRTIKVKCTIENDILILKKYNMPAADFYKLCKKHTQRAVITIGKDLVTRAVSFVSRCKENQLCATTMIYIPSRTMHATGHIQTIGRILGCVRKDLVRTLFSPQDVIDNYINTNMNQDIFLEQAKRNVSGNTMECWYNFVPEHNTTINMDRPKLALGKNFGAGQMAIMETRSSELSLIRRSINSWKRPNDNSYSSKIFKLFLENEHVHKDVIHETLNEAGSTNIDGFITQLTTSMTKCYKFIYQKTGDMYHLTTLARDILNNNK